MKNFWEKISIFIIICLVICILITYICHFIIYIKLLKQIKILEENISPIVVEVIDDLPKPSDIDDPEATPPSNIEESAPTTEAPTSLATMIAKIVWGEARGLGQTEQSCVVWTILNRADAWGESVEAIITAPNQFYYDLGFPTIDDHGRDITVLVQEILTAWENNDDSIRTLPENYFFYVGDGHHNYFYADYNNPIYWDYSYGSPYSD